MEALSPVATRFNTLTALRAYSGERKSLMSAPMDFAPEAQAYIAQLEISTYSSPLRADQPEIFAEQLTIYQPSGVLTTRHVHDMLQDNLPKHAGKQSLIESLVEAHTVFNEVRRSRGEDEAMVFALEAGNYVSNFNWHRDNTAIITLRGPATCWLPNRDKRSEWRMMDKQSFNMWDDKILHSIPEFRMKTEVSRLLAVMV